VVIPEASVHASIPAFTQSGTGGPSQVLAPRETICPAFRAIGIPPDPKEAHNSHTCAVEIRFHRDLRGVLLI
jgi:hypothetical protein